MFAKYYHSSAEQIDKINISMQSKIAKFRTNYDIWRTNKKNRQTEALLQQLRFLLFVKWLE